MILILNSQLLQLSVFVKGKTMKKLIFVLLTAFLLTGCHGGNSDVAQETSPATETTVVATTTEETTGTATETATATTISETAVDAVSTTNTEINTATVSDSETSAQTATQTVADTKGANEMKEETKNTVQPEENYLPAEVETVEFDEEDVITTSNQNNSEKNIELPPISFD